MMWLVGLWTNYCTICYAQVKLKDEKRLQPAHVSMLKMNNVWMAMKQRARRGISWAPTGR